MYEYKFERIELNVWTGKPKNDYEDIVHQRAAEGWRLMQVFSPPNYAGWQSTYIDLIFERHKEA